MASIGHVAVGLAAARLCAGVGPSERRFWGTAAFFVGLSMLPDADVVGFPLGVRYDAPLGHRGASHGLFFAVIVGAVMGLVARWGRGRAWVPAGHSALSLGLLAGLVVASHGLLDALTDGGLGVGFFWPFSAERHFLPWRPIPVAPIGLRFASWWGLRVAVIETLCFAPLLLYAFWRPAGARPVPVGEPP